MYSTVEPDVKEINYFYKNFHCTSDLSFYPVVPHEKSEVKAMLEEKLT